jgi:hypothetical protein
MPQLNSFIQVAFLAASVLLGICFMVDLPTHIGRGLGLWEKVSHPIDAFFLGLSFLVGHFAVQQQSSNMFWLYCAISLITLLLSYKDEAIHQKECPQYEQFIHAFMFSLNGIILTLGAIMIIQKVGDNLFCLGIGFSAFSFLGLIASNFITPAPKQVANS